jgi:hypothetical protein
MTNLFYYLLFDIQLIQLCPSHMERTGGSKKKFSSTEAVLAEMHTIRCIEHGGKLKFITPFVGAQVDICKAFGFTIPDGCAPAYLPKTKPTDGKLGRPSKPKTER